MVEDEEPDDGVEFAVELARVVGHGSAVRRDGPLRVLRAQAFQERRRDVEALHPEASTDQREGVATQATSHVQDAHGALKAAEADEGVNLTLNVWSDRRRHVIAVHALEVAALAFGLAVAGRSRRTPGLKPV
jgi:hypothetical protein